MILFTFPDYKKQAEEILKLPIVKLGKFSVSRFANGEMYVKLGSEVRNEDCLVLASIAPPDEQLLANLFLAHTLKKEGARKIIGCFPYLGYSRQDKFKTGESMATDLVGRLLEASSFDEILTIDVHSSNVRQLFPLPLESISPARVFAEELQKLGLQSATLVAPDEGALERTRKKCKSLTLQKRGFLGV